MFHEGSKTNQAIGAQRVPGVIVSEPVPGTVTYASKATGEQVTRPTFFADVVTRRETNPDGPNPGRIYFTLRQGEDLGFLFSRTSHEVGLDVEPDGTMIAWTDLPDKAFESWLEYRTEQAAASTPAEVAI